MSASGFYIVIYPRQTNSVIYEADVSLDHVK